VRAFNPRKFIDAKIRKLNDYMRKSGLSGCVLSVSGGIDSAVTYGLMMEVGLLFRASSFAFSLFFFKQGFTSSRLAH
jgi:NH3-dependent NAD+ synthetase